MADGSRSFNFPANAASADSSGEVRAIDLFAGSGLFSRGAEDAGVKVVWAANHWKVACEAYANNHPIRATCQDLHQADWTQVPAHDLLIASPACTGHTPARGKDRPHHDADRATAWAVVSALECHRPALGVIENVIAFTRWALFPAWCQAIEGLGYAISPHRVDFADLGVPQNRERVIIVLSRSKHPLLLNLPKLRHVPALEIIDFDDGRWSLISKPGRSPKTIARIQNGRRAHGDRFLAPYYTTGSGETGRSLSRPIGTIPTRDRWAVIDGDRMRMLTITEARRAMTAPDDYWLPAKPADAMKLLGNAVPALGARHIFHALRIAA